MGRERPGYEWPSMVNSTTKNGIRVGGEPVVSGEALTATGIKAEARRLGFDLCGICPATAPPGVERLRSWLAAGYAGEMHYLPDRAEAAGNPRHVLDGARSIVMLAMN